MIRLGQRLRQLRMELEAIAEAGGEIDIGAAYEIGGLLMQAEGICRRRRLATAKVTSARQEPEQVLAAHVVRPDWRQRPFRTLTAAERALFAKRSRMSVAKLPDGAVKGHLGGILDGMVGDRAGASLADLPLLARR